MPCADDGLGAQPKPAAKQPAVKSVEAIIVRPAASSLPRILCNTKVAASSSHTQQQQAPLQTDAPALSQGEAGSKRKAALDHEQTLPRQRSRSLTPSADEATPVAHVGADANLEGPAAAAPHEPLMPALSKQDNKQTTFNVITSGEQPHFMTKQQLMVKKVQPSPFAEQLEPQVMGTFASRAPFVGSHSHDVHGQPVDIDSSTGSDMQKASSRSFDSFHLPACDMPNLVFGVGSTGIAQLEAWESGFDAQLLHSELGVNAEAMPHNQDGSLTAQSKAWDWCNLVAQGLELNSQSAPDMPELPLLSEMPPVLPQHQGWQADEQNQQSEQQHLHHGSQQQQAYQALPRPHAADATCSVAAPAASCAEAGGCGSEVDWWMLPHCSMHNMFQADAVPSPGACRLCAICGCLTWRAALMSIHSAMLRSESCKVTLGFAHITTAQQAAFGANRFKASAAISCATGSRRLPLIQLLMAMFAVSC